jgi:putative ABC transport system permease protein
MILAWNLAVGDLVSTSPVAFTGVRFIMSSVITYGLLVIIVCLAIYFPSRQAMKIQPAEALHEE